MGGISPHQLEFFGKFFSGFENLITLTNFKWNFKAFRSRIKHFKVLKTHQGRYFTHLKFQKRIGDDVRDFKYVFTKKRLLSVVYD
jgi:hypothetical protein